MTDRSAGNRPSELGALLVPVIGDQAPGRPQRASGGTLRRSHVCSERLPRDVLVRLAALSRQVGDIRQEHAAHMDLSLRLDGVATGLDAVIQSIYDETVQHLAGRRV